MNDLTSPDDGLTEFASAYLDGAVTADERARVEADPQLMALVAALRSVSQAVAATTVVAPDTLREQHLAAALAIFVTDAEAKIATSSAARRPSWRTRWLMPLIGAGAATLVVAGVGLATLGGGDDGGTANDAARATIAPPAPSLDAAAKHAPVTGAESDQAPTATDPTAAGAADMAVPENGSVLSATVLPATAGFIPSASTPDELPGLVAAAAAEVAATRITDPCPQIGGTLVSELSWQGIPALLYSVPGNSAGVQVLAVEAATCATLASAVLPG